MTVTRLPPAAKLSLMDRKNVRDSFDSIKPELEKEISDMLGTAWTIEVDPKDIVPYLTNDTQGRAGDVIREYMNGAVWGLKNFISNNKDNGKNELNTAAPKHILSFDMDEAGKYEYCGPMIKDGVLYVVFNPNNFFCNVDSGLEESKLLEVMSASPAAKAEVLSPTAKLSIAKRYDPKSEGLRKQIADALNMPDIKLVPNFEHNYTKLKAAQEAGVDIRKDWEEALARAAIDYFDELRFSLNSHKFPKDDLLQEAFAEVVTEKEIVLRAIDELKHGGKRSESCFENGRLYIDFTPKTFWVNAGGAGQMIVDRLNEVA
ncbi:hypothetical protein CcaverHIS002_0403090 [Cutaneotrichosporon cavernicola]|uniref:Uncharacterized protein n=1 Tax=Cutaneotrichosporon cavernicola TaxID=279322 RepID=A0AA48QVM2_9TREE|nr:uncharacterized protein CcaverHIS019_0403050 [Cutaneotrichosporon cavernicola]BEI83705.1 hypothetical protein CcaverHIS002_0403090 [Cutaneotrichosporon cavernicola]BEI91485.1 hypothetical protein CcaverHIS019_0403050 [Cutaneotrichosporon cavernicola]